MKEIYPRTNNKLTKDATSRIPWRIPVRIFRQKADPRQYNSAGAVPGCFPPEGGSAGCLAEAGKGHFAKNGYEHGFSREVPSNTLRLSFDQ